MPKNRMRMNGESPAIAPAPQKLSPTEAAALLAQDRQERVNACVRELKELLDKYQCQIDGECTLSVGKIDVKIIVNPRVP